jgi:hypothetical protein
MFFTYDLFELGAIAFVVSRFLIQYYYISLTSSGSQPNNESLVNTNSLSNLDSNVQLTNLSNQNYVDAVMQTEANVETINTGVQTSSRIWLNTISNWINDILGSTANHQYKDAGVQTGTRSAWELFKQSFNKFYNFGSSNSGSRISTPTNVKVNAWMSELDSTQSVDHHDSESPLSVLKF